MNSSSLHLPMVSVIMPVINEERHLQHSVERILQQDYPGGLEVIVAVGPSRDRTAEVAVDIAARDARVQVVENPSGKTPSGLNAAIQIASGEVIVRVDGHAMIPSDYITVAVETLQTSGADNVGGMMNAEGTTDFEQAAARAMTSRFGVGEQHFMSVVALVRHLPFTWDVFAARHLIESAATTSRWSGHRIGK